VASPERLVTTELAYLSAGEALARFRTCELSPVELMEAVIARSEATEPAINALTDTYFEEGLARAAAAADAYAAGTARPLEGIPVAFKDETAVAGQRLAQGSLVFRDDVPDWTDPTAQRVLDAGGIVHARTAAPEFSMAIYTWTLLHGVSRNLWNPDITCGGSSGGAGASLAAGSTTLANGSDIAGSIRIPAAMNGLVGFKPPFGRNQDPWPWNREPYVASGPLARTVGDAILLQNVIQGPLHGDIWSEPRFELPDAFPPLEGMVVALSPDLGYVEVDAEIAGALEAAAEQLRSLGARVEPVALDWGSRTRDVVLDHLRFQSGTVLESHLPDGVEDLLTPYMREFLERPKVSVEEWIAGWEYLDHLYRDVQEKVFLAGFDALVCPTTATTDIPADLGHPDSGLTEDLAGQLDLVLTYPFNALGRLPVVSFPIGLAPSTGVPIGMQIVGPALQDDVPFRVAAGLEAEWGPFFERHGPPPTGGDW
jgi:Asp-tRNA(Asn)/Glu-tRNA(Gln) amidotransferase A subunit family amidase